MLGVYFWTSEHGLNSDVKQLGPRFERVGFLHKFRVENVQAVRLQVERVYSLTSSAKKKFN
jgi:hypothetical protein